MKTFFTSAILLLSLFALGQSNQLIGSEITEIKDPLNPNYYLKAAQSASFAQRDSSNFWFWNQPNNGWNTNAQSANINYTYDVNNNITSFVRRSWTGSSWVNTGQYFYSYDSNNNLLMSTSNIWTAGAWQNYFKYTYTYDSNNNLLGYTSESGSSGAWVNVNRRTYTYNSNNQQTYFLFEMWDGTNWENVNQQIYTYSPNNGNQLIYHLVQDWDVTAWKNLYQDTSYYNGNGNLINNVGQSWNGTMWENSDQMSYGYNANNNQTSFTKQIWNTGAWENEQKCAMTYTNNKLNTEIFQNWNGTAWENTTKKMYTWGGVNNLTMTNNVIQDWIGGQWTNASTFDEFYDANGFLESQVSMSFDSTGTITSADSSYHYTHLVATGINNAAGRSKNITIYPNPAISELNISTTLNYQSIKIVNALGETSIAKEDKPRSIVVSDLATGVYYIQLVDKKGTVLKTERFIKN
jgi:hypothetical protein